MRFLRSLAKAWGKVRRTPALPHSSPTDPEPVRPTWAAYDALMARHQSYPGWTFCRFGVRGPSSDDHSEVQGIVRAPFGAWWAPFMCVDPSDNSRASHGLACVEHTRSGMAIGVFSNMDVAVEAAEIAMRLTDWTYFSITDMESLVLIRRVRSAWTAAGIVPMPFHAYPMVGGEVPPGMPAVSIFAKPPVEEYRPERLT